MGRIRMKDPQRAVFEIDSTALSFWEHREGYEVLGPVEEPAPTPPTPEATSGPKPDKQKAAPRPASDDKE